MLEPASIFSGIFSVIVVVIFTYVGLRIASKYFKLKQRIFLLVGITWILLAEPWWPSATSFLIAIIQDSDGLQSTPEIYFLLGNLFLPVALIVWFTAFTELLYKQQQKIIVSLAVVLGVVFEIVFLFLLFNNPSAIGELQGPVDVDYQYWIMGLLLTLVVLVGITGYLFSRESLRSNNPEIKLKGKLLLSAFICFCIAATLDAAVPLEIGYILITRIILITSAVCFYGGFILPDWMKKLFGVS